MDISGKEIKSDSNSSISGSENILTLLVLSRVHAQCNIGGQLHSEYCLIVQAVISSREYGDI